MSLPELLKCIDGGGPVNPPFSNPTEGGYRLRSSAIRTVSVPSTALQPSWRPDPLGRRDILPFMMSRIMEWNQHTDHLTFRATIHVSGCSQPPLRVTVIQTSYFVENFLLENKIKFMKFSIPDNSSFFKKLWKPCTEQFGSQDFTLGCSNEVNEPQEVKRSC